MVNHTSKEKYNCSSHNMTFWLYTASLLQVILSVKKTGNIQSKCCNPHPKWPHCETNNYISLLNKYCLTYTSWKFSNEVLGVKTSSKPITFGGKNKTAIKLKCWKKYTKICSVKYQWYCCKNNDSSSWVKTKKEKSHLKK